MSILISFPECGNIGDKIKINDYDIGINVSYQLIKQENNNKDNNEDNNENYYKITTKSGVDFFIDKKDIFQILYCNFNDKIIIPKWESDRHNSKFIMSQFNDSYINIINYLKKDYTNLGNKKINVKFNNGNYYDFRKNNINNIKILGKNSNKFKYVDTKPQFFDNNIIKVIDTKEGHVKKNGCNAGITRNLFKIIEKTSENGLNEKYCEISLGKFDKDNNEFTFIIDEEDKCILDVLYFTDNKVFYKQTDILNNNSNKIYTITNPTWYLLDSQYIVSSIDIKGYDAYLVYIHRLLMGCHKDDNKTVDHINGNKFDNRKSNLRVVSMTEQNMNRNLVKRNTILDDIINLDSKLPKLSFENLLFIGYRDETKCEYFSIEIKKCRTGLNNDIKQCSTSASLFTDDKYKSLRIKLSHAICIRYLIVVKYPSIIKEKIDNKKYQSTEEFKEYTNSLISEVMGIQYTIDSFIDYMLSLKIPKFNDPRINKSVATTQDNINDIKFTYLQYNTDRDKYNVEFVANKEKTPRIKYKIDGCGSKNITTADKKAYALVQRYNLFITLENDINKQIHHNTNTQPDISIVQFNPIFPDNINKNVSNLKSLTDYDIENEKFKSFNDFRIYTELCINKLLTPIEMPFTMETFKDYLNKKANNKKIELKILKLEYPDYPILTS